MRKRGKPRHLRRFVDKHDDDFRQITIGTADYFSVEHRAQSKVLQPAHCALSFFQRADRLSGNADFRSHTLRRPTRNLANDTKVFLEPGNQLLILLIYHSPTIHIKSVKTKLFC